MRRPKLSMPLELKNLQRDIKTGKYLISENGITYAMDLEQTRLLKEYYKFQNFDGKCTLEAWYRDLSKFDKAAIIRTGDIERPTDDFIPDATWED